MAKAKPSPSPITACSGKMRSTPTTCGENAASPPIEGATLEFSRDARDPGDSPRESSGGLAAAGTAAPTGEVLTARVLEAADAMFAEAVTGAVLETTARAYAVARRAFWSSRALVEGVDAYDAIDAADEMHEEALLGSVRDKTARAYVEARNKLQDCLAERARRALAGPIPAATPGYLWMRAGGAYTWHLVPLLGELSKLHRVAKGAKAICGWAPRPSAKRGRGWFEVSSSPSPKINRCKHCVGRARVVYPDWGRGASPKSALPIGPIRIEEPLSILGVLLLQSRSTAAHRDDAETQRKVRELRNRGREVSRENPYRRRCSRCKAPFEKREGSPAESRHPGSDHCVGCQGHLEEREYLDRMRKIERGSVLTAWLRGESLILGTWPTNDRDAFTEHLVNVGVAEGRLFDDREDPFFPDDERWSMSAAAFVEGLIFEVSEGGAS